MAASMETLIEEAQAGFIPPGGQALIITMESFPDFAEALQLSLQGLSEWLSGELSDAATGEKVAEMVTHAAALHESAKQAAQTFAQGKNRMWAGHD
jgi:hypothetical protein